MDTVDRLAAWLAGDLDSDERAALTAELERDPALRSQLEAMRRADEALRNVGPPEPPEGFEARLDTHVTRVLADVLPTAADGDPALVERDELGERRSRRARRGWLVATAGAAATVAALAGVVALSDLGAGDEEATGSAGLDREATMELFTEEAEPEEEEAGPEEPASEESEAQLAPPEDAAGEAGPEAFDAVPEVDVDGPVLVADQRDIVDEDVDELGSRRELTAIAERALDEDDGSALARRFASAFGLGTDGDSAADTEAEADAPTSSQDTAEDAPEGGEPSPEAGDAPPPDELRLPEGPPAPEAFDAARTCLGELLSSHADAIPAYVELTTYDGDDAVLVGLVAVDPDTGRYTRIETWVMDRGTCQVLRFSRG